MKVVNGKIHTPKLLKQKETVFVVEQKPDGNIIAYPAGTAIASYVIFNPPTHKCYFKELNQPPVALPNSENIQEVLHHAIKKGLLKI